MVAALILTMALAAGPVFQVQTLDLENAQAHVFLARGDADNIADVFILNPKGLRWYGSQSGAHQTPFVSGTNVFDIADVDGDGQNELVFIAGDRIMRSNLTEPFEVKVLFRFHTQFAEVTGPARPHVLVVPYKGSPALALPGLDTFELRRADGSVVLSQPVHAGAPHRVQFRKPFTIWTIDPPQVAPPGSIERYVSHVVDYEPQLPKQLAPLLPLASRALTEKPRLVSAGELHYANWPSFPLKAGAETSVRVLYALSEPDEEDTVIRLDQRVQENGDRAPSHNKVSPERLYPGKIITGSPMPDFNGDGYADLLLWKTPDPLNGWSLVSRAISTRTWPVRLMAHLFSPEKMRYEPRPLSVIETHAPLSWFVQTERGSPVHNLVMADFNADGRTDLAFSTSESTYGVWLATKDGFTRRPTQVVTLSEPVESVALVTDLDGSGAAAVGLRGHDQVFLLRPAGAAPKTP